MAETIRGTAMAVESATALFGPLLALISPAIQPARPTRLHSAHAREATDEVLQAADLQDLTDRLNALVGDTEFWKNESAAVDRPKLTADVALANLAASSLDMASLISVLGTTAASRCAEGYEALKATAPALYRWRVHMQKMVAALGVPDIVPAPTSTPAGPGDPGIVAASLYSSALPLGFRKELAGFLCSMMASFAIARAEERGVRLEPWLALGLADTFARWPERALAYMSGDRIPVLLSGLAADISDSVRVTRETERWRVQALASGQGIYEPLGDTERAEA